jgi:hypothetical protein
MTEQKREIKGIIVLIGGSRGDRLIFTIIYPVNREETPLIPYTRTIVPISEKDFQRWMYEFIVFWKITPIAVNKEILESAEEILKKDERYNRGVYKWREGSLSISEDSFQRIQQFINTSLTLKEAVRIFNLSGVKITEATIRYYEKEGMIPKIPIVDGRKRVTKEIMDDIEKIKHLQSEKKSINEIKGVIARN